MSNKPPGQTPDMGWETRSSVREEPAETPSEAMHAAMARLAELREYIGYFISAKADSLKATLRNAGIYAALGLLAAVMGATFIVVASTLLLIGAAHGIGAAFGDRYWLGDLIIGVVVLGAVTAGAFLGLKMLTGSSRKKTVEKYETRQHEQRRRYGHDVKQRAKE